MNDIYSTVVCLCVSPFMALPMLENVAGMSKEEVSDFLQQRRKEMVELILARYLGEG